MSESLPLEGATVFVTGAGGFLGRALVSRLAEADVELHGLLHSDPDESALPGGLRSHVGSITDGDFLQRCVDAVNPDIVYHLAAQTSEAENLERVNIEGTRNVLEASVAANCPNFVFTSSAMRYADTPSPKAETDSVEPRTRYGVSKRAGELLCQYYSRRYALSTAVAIPFLLYGPAEFGPRGLIPAAITAGLADDPFEVRCSDHIRDPVFVDDAVDALLEAPAHMGRADHFLFNVCTGEERSVRDVVRSIYAHLDTTIDPEFRQLNACENEPAYLVGDPSNTTDTIGWRPQVGWEAGLRRTVDSFR